VLSLSFQLKDFLFSGGLVATGLADLRRKLKLPFRIGTTSYIWPADIMANVRRLKCLVDDVELVLFESACGGNIPDGKSLDELSRLNSEYGLTYTVHLPLDLNLGSVLPGERNSSLSLVKYLTRHMLSIRPRAFILHLNPPDDIPGGIPSWQKAADDSLKKLSSFERVSPQAIAVENLSYPFSYAEKIVLDNGFSVCADIGHLIIMGVDPVEHLSRYFDRVTVIHLHGVEGGKDHVSLKHLNPGLLKEITGMLVKKGYRGILTLEVFTQADFEESMEILWENLYS